MHRDPMTFKIK